MSRPPEKVVAFLDLLGFSEAVRGDLPGAVGLLRDYVEALTTAVEDATSDGSAGIAPVQRARPSDMPTCR